MRYKLILLQLIWLLPIALQANNVTISNTNYDGNETITFDLTWENSWRTSITQPYNYDGVWIFVKVRECTQKNLGSPTGFTHAWLSTTVTDHSATNSAPGGEALTIEMGNTDVAATPRGMGVFIYQTANVTEATNISTTVTLRWDKATQAGQMAAIDVADNYDVEVFGIEMVYIPQGDFYLGDGASSNCFQDATNNPYLVTSEASFTVSGTDYRDINSAVGNVNANFPKGWNSFWIMKYEITQLQYAEFLNTLTPTQAQERTEDDLFTMTTRNYVMSNSNAIQSRQAIILDPQGDKRTDRFFVNLDNDNNYNEAEDGLGVACNYLSLRDVFAYMDWAALRPLTELEYEKACRGPIYPQLNEYAWGSVGITSIQGVVNSGQTSERAIASGVGLCNYGGTGVGSSGPMRGGFAATSTTNRSQAGCSYYGVMDLTGNVYEPYISFYNSTAITDLFTGLTGDGELTVDGYHNVTTWPSRTADADFSICLGKGGAWLSGSGNIHVSRRNEEETYDNATYVVSRSNYNGGRGGR
jgi:formylglycine-generating enzyme required for sulfatase activity